MKTRQILFAKRPQGMPNHENFQFAETELPAIQAGELLVKTLYLSVDPYMRGRMNDAKSYIPPFQVGQVLSGGVVGQVIASHHEKFRPGDFVSGTLPWQDYAISNGAGLHTVNPSHAPVSTALGILGMPGLTAYFGLLEIGQPKAGETVVVSGAAGAVGTIVGQIAKLKGCYVVGIAGSEEKNAYLRDELGFDVVLNYKTEINLRKSLRESCPNGIDVYFDNVGGDITDAVMMNLRHGARIALCGQISLYNLEKIDVGPRILSQLLINSALMKGFIVSDYASKTREGIAQLANWLAEGKLKYRENIVEGLENVPDAFLGLFRGDNLGKQLVKVAEPAQL